jgi:hypothetical protein
MKSNNPSPSYQGRVHLKILLYSFIGMIAIDEKEVDFSPARIFFTSESVL